MRCVRTVHRRPFSLAVHTRATHANAWAVSGTRLRTDSPVSPVDLVAVAQVARVLLEEMSAKDDIQARQPSPIIGITLYISVVAYQ
jgi:hypothetical protein